MTYLAKLNEPFCAEDFVLVEALFRSNVEDAAFAEIFSFGTEDALFKAESPVFAGILLFAVESVVFVGTLFPDTVTLLLVAEFIAP